MINASLRALGSRLVAMNLPQMVEDPSLLEHEPLCTHIAIFECAGGQRSAAKDLVSKFVKEMQKDGQVRTQRVSRVGDLDNPSLGGRGSQEMGMLGIQGYSLG